MKEGIMKDDIVPFMVDGLFISCKCCLIMKDNCTYYNDTCYCEGGVAILLQELR